MLNKITFLIFILINYSLAMAAPTWFIKPTLPIKGVEHFLVATMENSNEYYNSARGFCVRKGFKIAGYAVTGREAGPFVILNEEGKIIQTYPAEGNQKRFWAVRSVGCEIINN